MSTALAKNRLVRLANAVHVAVVCPTDGGKGVSCVIPMAIKLMCEFDCWSGMPARMGGQLTYVNDREKNSTLTSMD